MSKEEEKKLVQIIDKSGNRLSGFTNMTSKDFWRFEKHLKKKMNNSTITKIDADWKNAKIIIENKMNEASLSKLQLAYREFFKAKMEEFGVKSPVELRDDKTKKEFWNQIKKEWPQAKRKIQEGLIRQTIRSMIVEVLEDSIPGGKGDNTEPGDVDPKQLEVGISVEMEHTDSREKAEEIALDHLTEDPNYYSKLINADLVDEPEALKIAKKNGITEGADWKRSKDLSGKVNYSIDKRDYTVEVTKQLNKKYVIWVEITRNDTVNQNALTDLRVKWNQEQTGYEIIVDNETDLMKVLKVLKVKMIPKNMLAGISEDKISAKELIQKIRPGSRVTIRTPQKQTVSGKVVMKSDPKYGAGWVLNLGGRYGRPGRADEKNIVSATIDKKKYIVEGINDKITVVNLIKTFPKKGWNSAELWQEQNKSYTVAIGLNTSPPVNSKKIGYFKAFVDTNKNKPYEIFKNAISKTPIKEDVSDVHVNQYYNQIKGKYKSKKDIANKIDSIERISPITKSKLKKKFGISEKINYEKNDNQFMEDFKKELMNVKTKRQANEVFLNYVEKVGGRNKSIMSKMTNIVKNSLKEGNVSRGGMKIEKIYKQILDNMDLYFKPTEKTNNGMKGILYTHYIGRKISGKNPKKYSVSNVDMDLWHETNTIPASIKSKLNM